MSTPVLDKALQDIEREFGRGSILNLSDAPQQSVQAVSTGSLQLDLALGVGGMARGRVVEIYGPESSGKTTVVQHVLANAQAEGLRCAYIDAEHAFDPGYAAATGINVDELLFSQPDYGEQALEIAIRLVRTGCLGVVAIDSVAALTPKVELDGEMGDATVGAQARMMGQALRKMAGAAGRSGTLVVFVNQIREKVGVMFGSPETTPGGRALRFFSSQRIDVRRIGTDKSGGEAYQNRVRAKVVKNKVAPPFKQAEFNLRFGEGIDTIGELLDLGVEQKRIKKSSSWYELADIRAQGFDQARTVLAELPELMGSIREEALS